MGKRNLVVVLVMALVLPLATAPPVLAQPANDNLADATDLGNDPTPAAFGNDIGATGEVDEPNHDGQAPARTVWFKWTAPADATMTVDTCHPSNYDTIVEVYSGPAGIPTYADLTSLDADNDGCGGTSLGSRVRFGAIAGHIYYVVIDRTPTAFGNTYSVNFEVGPPNDDFPGTTLSGSPVTAFGANVGATKESGEPDHAGVAGGASVWWSWTAPTTADFIVHTCATDPQMDTALAVYTGGTFTGGVTEMESNDDHVDCFQMSKLSFAATAGTIYRIAVDGGPDLGGGAATGPIRLDIALDIPDTIAPTVVIDDIQVKRRKATITFSVTDNLPGNLTIECKLDIGIFTQCVSPVSYTKLKRGQHTIEVRATDPAGNTGSDTRTFKIRRR